MDLINGMFSQHGMLVERGFRVPENRVSQNLLVHQLTGSVVQPIYLNPQETAMVFITSITKKTLSFPLF